MAKPSRRDPYEVLGVARDVDDVELKRAFRELARRHHPDVNPDDAGAGERFREINEAYATLSDPAERSRFDRFGHRGDGAEVGGFGAVAQAMEEVLGDVLRRRRNKRRGRDLRYTLEVDFEEAALGATKTIDVPDGPVDRSGSAAGGAGRVKQFQVVIPPGTREGAVRMLAGEGEPGSAGGAPGDLHVIVRVRPHKVLRREGNDIASDLTVTFPQAALGAVVEVPTIDGPVKMRIPEGSQPGRVFRLRGRGVPRSADKDAVRGDHLVHLSVEVPTDLSPAQREAVEALAVALGAPPSPPRRKPTFIDKVRSLLDD